jgi:Tfp pilus assembly protein PilV
VLRNITALTLRNTAARVLRNTAAMTLRNIAARVLRNIAKWMLRNTAATASIKVEFAFRRRFHYYTPVIPSVFSLLQ